MSHCEPVDDRDLRDRIIRLEKLVEILVVSEYNSLNKCACKDIEQVKSHSYSNDSVMNSFISEGMKEVFKPKKPVSSSNISLPKFEEEICCCDCSRFFKGVKGMVSCRECAFPQSNDK